MARVQLPRTSLRARRRRRRLIVAIVLVVIALVALAVLVGLSYVPFLRVTTIAVSGEKTISQRSITSVVLTDLQGAHWYLFPRSNIFLYPKTKIAGDLLKQFPALKSVDVHAQDFHTVAVNVTEREAKALWCAPNSCYYMDQDGVAYAEAPDFSEPIYVSYLGGGGEIPHQFLTTEEFRDLSALVDAISQTEPDDPVREVVVDVNGDVRAYFQNDFLLMFALKDASGDVYDRFTLALKSAPFVGKKLSDFEYLDLRFGDKLYYKLKNE